MLRVRRSHPNELGRRADRGSLKLDLVSLCRHLRALGAQRLASGVASRFRSSVSAERAFLFSWVRRT
jgi:hypothetical protein